MNIGITIIAGFFFGFLWAIFAAISSKEMNEGTNKQFGSRFLTALYKKRPVYVNILTSGVVGILLMFGCVFFAFSTPIKLGFPDSYLATYTTPAFVIGFFIGKLVRKYLWVKYVQHM